MTSPADAREAARGAAIFDLDGTLTVPVLDFDAIRAEIGLPAGPILEALDKLDEDGRRRGYAILDRHEHVAAHNSILHDGARETLTLIRQAGWPLAVLTRNTRHWTQFVLDRHGLAVDALWTRDDGAIKPSPRPILELCGRLACDPAASWMIGDHLFDLQSGRAAGCNTVLMTGSRPPPSYAHQADYVISSLRQLVGLLLS